VICRRVVAAISKISIFLCCSADEAPWYSPRDLVYIHHGIIHDHDEQQAVKESGATTQAVV
jgi:hypothetical protein